MLFVVVCIMRSNDHNDYLADVCELLVQRWLQSLLCFISLQHQDICSSLISLVHHCCELDYSLSASEPTLTTRENTYRILR